MYFYNQKWNKKSTMAFLCVKIWEHYHEHNEMNKIWEASHQLFHFVDCHMSLKLMWRLLITCAGEECEGMKSFQVKLEKFVQSCEFKDTTDHTEFVNRVQMILAL